jgi:hypothetical protein
MVDTLWADVSEYQRVVDDRYPHPVLAIRACDGAYRDKNFHANHNWARAALDAGKLHVLIIYLVYRPNWQQSFDTLRSMVGDPHPRTVVMIDVESWGGQITGDHSSNLNNLHAAISQWLGNPRRVIGYGNANDLNTLWPRQPQGIQHVIAAYGHKPSYPGMIAHQFADDCPVDPFGPCDANSADGLAVHELSAALGLDILIKKGRASMISLPATDKPSDINSDPSKWPERNYNVGWNVAGGWEGDVAFSLGVQDWGGRTDNSRGFLFLASWIFPGDKLTPVDQVYTAAGGGQTLNQHSLTSEYVAPKGCVGVTFNYAAPAGAFVALGRSGR